MTIKYYPPSLKVVVDRGKERALRNTEVSLYCDQCPGKHNEHFGNFIAMMSLLDALVLVKQHDSNHKIYLVDEGACGFGVF
jgi:hypothetical protein